MKIKNQYNFFTGILIVIVQILVLLKYFQTGCISMPQVPVICNPHATGPIIGLIIFGIAGIYLIISGLDLTKHKD